jgi:hypothetical protein
VGNVLPKIYSSRVGLSNKKEFVENEFLEQKLQLRRVYPPPFFLKTKVTGVSKHEKDGWEGRVKWRDGEREGEVEEGEVGRGRWINLMLHRYQARPFSSFPRYNFPRHNIVNFRCAHSKEPENRWAHFLSSPSCIIANQLKLDGCSRL